MSNIAKIRPMLAATALVLLAPGLSPSALAKTPDSAESLPLPNGTLLTNIAYETAILSTYEIIAKSATNEEKKAS